MHDRGELSVRVFGSAAVTVGKQVMTVPGRDPLVATITQTWINDGTRWRQVAYQASRLDQLS